MNQILAICDSETAYAYQMMDYFCNKKGLPFQLQLFTSLKTLEEYAVNHPVCIALIAEKDYEIKMKELQIEHIVILQEEFGEICGVDKLIYKYQSLEQIIKELLEWAAQDGITGRINTGRKGLKLIGIYSPVGRCLKTSFAFVLGQVLSKKHKVLYLNMESYSGLGKLLQRDFSSSLSELIYYLQNAKEKFIYHMGSMTQRAGELDILPPFDSYLDFISVSGDEWMQLFHEIENGSDYEYLILDLSDAVQGLYDILRACDYVYTLSREDGFAEAKIAQYEEILKKSNYEDIWKKTKYCAIPQIKNLPAGLLQLNFTELAEYVKTRVHEDLEENGK